MENCEDYLKSSWIILFLILVFSIASIVLTVQYFETPVPTNGREILEIEKKRAVIHAMNAIPIILIFAMVIVFIEIKYRYK